MYVKCVYNWDKFPQTKWFFPTSFSITTATERGSFPIPEFMYSAHSHTKPSTPLSLIFYIGLSLYLSHSVFLLVNIYSPRSRRVGAELRIFRAATRNIFGLAMNLRLCVHYTFTRSHRLLRRRRFVGLMLGLREWGKVWGSSTGGEWFGCCCFDTDFMGADSSPSTWNVRTRFEAQKQEHAHGKWKRRRRRRADTTRQLPLGLTMDECGGLCVDFFCECKNGPRVGRRR